MPKIVLLLIFCASCSSSRAPLNSDIKSDETVQFFRTSASFDESSDEWRVPIHGWVYELEESVARRGIFEALLDSQYDLEVTKDTEENFSRRLNLLIADSERDKEIAIDIAGQSVKLSPSEANGHFESVIVIAAKQMEEFRQGSLLRYSALSKGSRKFEGEVLLVDGVGVSVISDIDDTVKNSEVISKKKLLENSFLLDFEAAEGMASLYRAWADDGVRFHYVSSSPWQLFAPLQEFLDANGFPPADLNLKMVRFRDETLFDLFKKGTETKPAAIEEILRTYPERHFVLVGDSGEQDPEVYAALIKKHPQQIVKIFIRNVTSESKDNDRFSSVFDGIDADCWMLFDNVDGLTLP